MCTAEQKYDYCGGELVPTYASSEKSYVPPRVCSRMVVAPSLNAVLRGTLSPVDNLADIEHGIWYPDTPETFLQASLQFLENKLHTRIFQMAPTPSGKVVLSDGFIFSPIYPVTAKESQTPWDEVCLGVKVHNFSDEEDSYSWNDPKRVKSVIYSCISIPGEHGVKSIRDGHEPSLPEGDDVTSETQRDIGIQTSNDDLYFQATDMSSSMVSDDEIQPISNFSEYVQYCHCIVKPPSQLFNFGESTHKQISGYKFSDAMPEEECDITPENDMDDVPNSARTYVSHYRQERDSTVRKQIPPYESAMVQRSAGQSSKNTASTTTVSSAKSCVTNITGQSVYEKYHREVASSTASTKSVYYYARISASFFSFLNRATQKAKSRKNSRSSSIIPNVSSTSPSTISIPKREVDKTVSSADDDKDSKSTSAKLNVLRRFMNFFGGAKSSKEYDKFKEPSAAIIDVTTGFFDDDNIFKSEIKPSLSEKNENNFKCNNSFSVPGRNSTITQWSTNMVASERTVESNESKLLSRSSRKVQTKPKSPRHTQKDIMRDSDQYSRNTTVVDFPIQQRLMESNLLEFVRKPSQIVSSIFGSKTSYSKTVCKDILKLRFEGEAMPVTATDTSHDENESFICYKPPNQYYHNNDFPPNDSDYKCNQTVLCATNNDNVCYARIPENQRVTGSYRQQQSPQNEQLQQKTSIRNFFKSHNDHNYSTSSAKEHLPELQPHGKPVPKQKSPIHNQYRPKPQEYITQQIDPPSMQRPFPNEFNSRTYPPVLRKQNAYFIEKPQVNPDRITRLFPDDKPKVWSGLSRHECAPPHRNKNQTESSDINSSFTTMSKTFESTEVNSSFSTIPKIIKNSFNGDSDVNSSLTTIPKPMSKQSPGIKGYQNHKHPPAESTTQNATSTSSSDFDGPTSYINNTVSNSSRSSYWLPPKRLARNNRDFPKLNNSNIFQMKPSFSKEVIKLFQRAPKSFKR